MTAAYLHVTAATPWITEASQSLFHWQVGDVVQDGPFRQKNNVVRVPEDPGLGVTLDAAAMKRWSHHFAEHGPMGHFHDPKLPGRYRRLPLH
jgi:glucarate dehydratase